MRSRTGCLTCRSRKLKCDERKPQCSQCRKASRECRPSESIVFRHQQNASMNKAGRDLDAGDSRALNGFYSYKNTFDENSVWLEIPKQVTFVDNSDPYAEEELNASLPCEAPAPVSNPQTLAWSSNGHYRQLVLMDGQAHGLETLSAVATRESHPLQPASSIPVHASLNRNNIANDIRFGQSELPVSLASAVTSNNIDPGISVSTPSPATSISPPNNNINFLLNPSASIPSPSDPSNLHSPLDQSEPSFTATGSSEPRDLGIELSEDLGGADAESDHEIAFLLRHFSEAPGLWMDLFDLGTYFSSYVPVKAVTDPLLKYAACAYAAKQLGLVKGHKAIVGGVCNKQAMMEVWPDTGKVDWYYYSAKYYEKAIQLLMEALRHDGESTPLSNLEAFGKWEAVELCNDAEHSRKRPRYSNSWRSSARSDEVLAATAILSVYEFHDATGPAWNRHLSGVKSLLDIAEVGMIPVEQRALPGGSSRRPARRLGLSKARKAAFWNFARQDYLSAFINECKTRLDTDDLILWAEAGLLLDEDGFVRPSNTANSGYPHESDGMREDLISNALIWILSKVVNFIVAGDGLDIGESSSSKASTGVSQRTPTHFERWHRLQTELDRWYNGLPDTFKPCARMDRSHPSSQDPNDKLLPWPEVWYSLPMCASTMQHFHMARILLLVNKPLESTVNGHTVTNKLKSYRSIESEIRFRTHEICGISMSRPAASARIHSVQPLFVAGQCLTEPRERKTILQLLRGVEDDLGWATEYRVKRLLKEWEWDEVPRNILRP
ncbi:hypothetical protein AJ78_04062 [Emergomyces pasteurianus Ep9510]|uniref:Zn(2)-C6 fungal-type domain-containing protein n=1 Tax=Emergomyces pasteurianus Ep9510 TaxID=1447872 RepID=A0A1J9PI56_9EURO|nr:hypothetical protein AJ78_04062 [Emergomyces pasteurianus Ep9510]